MPALEPLLSTTFNAEFIVVYPRFVYCYKSVHEIHWIALEQLQTLLRYDSSSELLVGALILPIIFSYPKLDEEYDVPSFLKSLRFVIPAYFNLLSSNTNSRI